MDPEGWKMAATSYDFLKHQSEMTIPKTLQVNYANCSTTERHQKKVSYVRVNERPEKLEGKLLLAKVRGGYGSGFTSGRQSQEVTVKPIKEQSTMSTLNKCAVKRWNTWIPDSVEHIENLAFTNYEGDAQRMAKQNFGVQAKKNPVQIRDSSGAFFTQRDKAQFFREDMKVNFSPTLAYTKETSAVLCHKTKIQGNKQSSMTQPMYGHGTGHLEESSLYLGIPFCHSRKKVMVQNSGPQSRLTESWQRIKRTAPETPVHGIDKAPNKIYDKHRLSYKDMPSVSTGCINKNDSSDIGRRTGVNMTTVNTQKEKLIRNITPSEDRADLELTDDTSKDKSVGNTKYRRFLLIDSQGLPYTVVVEEPKSKISKLPSESVVDNSNIGATKSIAPRKVYTCPVCFRIFEYLSYLQRHSIAHSQQKPHKCKICGKAFKRTSHLTRHKYTHFGGKPCQCQICHRRFRDAGELARHQLSHNGERPYQCNICHVRFGEHGALQNHLMSKHVK